MRKWLAIILIIILAGCNAPGGSMPGGNNDNNLGYGYEYDHVTPGGIMLRNRPADATAYISDAMLDQMLYDAAVSCAGIAPLTPPLVIYLTDEEWTAHGLGPATGTTTVGMSYRDHNLVLIRTSWAINPSIHRHEFLHLAIGDPNHTSWLWGTWCGTIDQFSGWAVEGG